MLTVYYIVPLLLPFAMTPKVWTGSPYCFIQNKILKFSSFLPHLTINFIPPVISYKPS